MASNIFRNRLINLIKSAISEANNNIGEIDHPGLKGRYRELACASLLKPVIPAGYSIGAGKISDPNGNLSGESDVVIYNSFVLPPIMYGEHDGVFPYHSTYYSIEVKSKVTSTEMKDCINKGRKLLSLDPNLNDMQGSSSYRPSSPIYCLFAFSTDLNGKDELERYSELDPDWDTCPIVRAICVVGSGYWYFSFNHTAWIYQPQTDEYDEVVDFISSVSNTLAVHSLEIKIGLLGNYTSIERDGVMYKPPTK